jgi:hypothetical protein
LDLSGEILLTHPASGCGKEQIENSAAEGIQDSIKPQGKAHRATPGKARGKTHDKHCCATPCAALGPMDQLSLIEVCGLCGKGMVRAVSASHLPGSGLWFEIFICPSCRPSASGTTASRMVVHKGTWVWDGTGDPLFPGGRYCDYQDPFTSHRWGEPLLMDGDAEMPWPEEGEDSRAYIHILSLVDHPEIGFDPTGYPLVIVADKDDLRTLSWVGDGR